MTLDQTVMRRLAFIKYLYKTAITQSRKPTPLNCASILMMHDSIELFLQLATEYLNVGTPQPGFMEYWEIINSKLGVDVLEQKESMRRLNKARVALKHHGTFPSNMDVESFCVSTTNFFLDNTKKIFSINIDDISMVEFVNPEESRKALIEAQKLIQSGSLLPALDKIALAFERIIIDYEDRKRNIFQESPFEFGKDMTYQSSFFIRASGKSIISSDYQLEEFVDNVREAIEAIQSTIRILAFGLDYRKYTRFKILTPRVFRMADGNLYVNSTTNRNIPPTLDDVEYCFDYTIESAIVLSEFYYTIKKEK